ncbi:MAG: hypothetical protein VB093_12780, partial [Propionicimonas sp.]|nr:hypothetical protein [Propionicimonas sp.]
DVEFRLIVAAGLIACAVNAVNPILEEMATSIGLNCPPRFRHRWWCHWRLRVRPVAARFSKQAHRKALYHGCMTV